MNTTVKMPVEQLWYTWSDVGLSSVHAGFRVRAASAGLTEIYSPRVQSMDRYMRYDLPPGTDPFAVTPDMTPVGLAFIRTNQNESILVHKNYSGKDGVGRPGNFFVHVLALGDYSRYFSAEDAIWLWDANLWQTNDQRLDRRSTTLNTIQFADLDSNPRFHPQYSQVRDALAFVIEAYLTRKGRTPIYIAAPAQQAALIAYIIAGLTTCLPWQFLADLTFSTYEPDLTKATTDIVGTSWITTLGQTAETVMPEQWYRDHLAINCATGEPSRLLGHPQIDTNPLAAHFAAYAAACLATNDMQQLEDLYELAEKSQALTVELFLQLYNDEIANAENISEVQIERNLTNTDLCLDRLNSQVFRKKIIDCVLKNPQWGETKLAPILGRLCDQAARANISPAGASTYAAPVFEQQAASSLTGPQKSSKRKNTRAQMKEPKLTLALALTELARRAIPEIVRLMRQAAKAQNAEAMSSSEPPLERQQISALITVMESCLTTQDSSEVWQDLFNTIIKSPNATDYLRTQRDIRFRLLRHWNNALPDTEEYNSAVRPLIDIPWINFGKFLHASLSGRHKQWLVFVVEGALGDPSLTPQIAQDLTQNFSNEVHALLRLLLQSENYNLATSLLIKLVGRGYKIRPPLDTLVEQLLAFFNQNGHWLPAKELVVALTQSSHIGATTYTGATIYQSQVEELLGYLLTSAPREGNELLDLLIEKGYPRKKALLDLLLKTGRADPESSIRRVYRTPEEQNAFFLHDATLFLQHRDYVQAMVSLYGELLRAFPQDGKMARLFVLLEGSLDEKMRLSLNETTLLSLMEKSSLTENEWIELLKRFGSRYFTVPVVRQAPYLAQLLLEWFGELVQKQYVNGANLLSYLLDPQIDPRYLELLLKYANLPADEQIRFLDTYGANYLSLASSSPSVLTKYINTYASYFTADDLEQPFFTTLMQHYQRLSLDEQTRNLIQSWQSISNYLKAPSTHPAVLSNLSSELFNQRLPNNVHFTIRLAHAFVRCIQTPEDLANIMDRMQRLPKLEGEQFRFLYKIAEQAAINSLQKTTDPQRMIGLLLPHLVFALSWPAPQDGAKHFRHVFLDRLLQNVQETDLSTWKWLDAIVMQQRLSQPAIAHWKFYLNRLGVLHQIDQAEVATSNAPARSQSSWSWLPEWLTGKNKQQPAEQVSTFQQMPVPPEQQSPSAPRGQISPPRQPQAIDLGSHSPQGGASFSVQSDDNNKKRWYMFWRTKWW